MFSIAIILMIATFFVMASAYCMLPSARAPRAVGGPPLRPAPRSVGGDPGCNMPTARNPAANTANSDVYYQGETAVVAAGATTADVTFTAQADCVIDEIYVDIADAIVARGNVTATRSNRTIFRAVDVIALSPLVAGGQQRAPLNVPVPENQTIQMTVVLDAAATAGGAIKATFAGRQGKGCC